MRPPVALILVACLLAAGCLEGESRAPGAPEDLRASLEGHVRAFLEGDVDGMLRYESDPWVDLGGGSCPYPAQRGNATTPAEQGPPGPRLLLAPRLLQNGSEPRPTPDDTSCDPANITHAERRVALQQFFGSSEHRAMVEGRTIEDLVLLDRMRQEDASTYLANFSFRGPFEPQPGDIAVHAMGPEGSPFFDGWSGIYREGDDRWVRVAGD